MDERDPREEEAKGEETAQREEGEASPVEGFSAMERLGRSFLEKHEESRSDLEALRNMHRRRTRATPQDPTTE